MKNKKKALGRGLEALLPSIGYEGETTVTREEGRIINTENEVLYIDIHKITPNSEQPRKIFREENLKELAQSIQEHGLI